MMKSSSISGKSIFHGNENKSNISGDRLEGSIVHLAVIDSKMLAYSMDGTGMKTVMDESKRENKYRKMSCCSNSHFSFDL